MPVSVTDSGIHPLMKALGRGQVLFGSNVGWIRLLGRDGGSWWQKHYLSQGCAWVKLPGIHAMVAINMK